MTSKRTIAVLVRRLDEEQALGRNPAASRLWLHAPPELRRQYANGHVSPETFWAGLRRWLVHDWKAAS